MARLIYSMLQSLDGYVEDENGDFGWGAPQLKADAERDLTVDGPELAAQALAAGLVDELQLIVNPVIVGGGKRFFPSGVRLKLELLDERGSRAAWSCSGTPCGGELACSSPDPTSEGIRPSWPKVKVQRRPGFTIIHDQIVNPRPQVSTTKRG